MSDKWKDTIIDVVLAIIVLAICITINNLVITHY